MEIFKDLNFLHSEKILEKNKNARVKKIGSSDKSKSMNISKNDYAEFKEKEEMKGTKIGIYI
jgi:hypothetical protein